MEIYSDQQLEFSSRHLIYHIRMYVETFLWLQSHSRPKDWDTAWNAVLESHLIHARVLINFLQYEKPKYKTDVIALNYLHNLQDASLPLQHKFLKDQSEKIGGQLVHLTTKSPLLKSEQEWQIGEITMNLIPAIQNFLNVVPNHRLPTKINEECKEIIKKISVNSLVSTIPLSTSSAT